MRAQAAPPTRRGRSCRCSSRGTARACASAVVVRSRAASRRGPSSNDASCVTTSTLRASRQRVSGAFERCGGHVDQMRGHRRRCALDDSVCSLRPSPRPSSTEPLRIRRAARRSPSRWLASSRHLRARDARTTAARRSRRRAPSRARRRDTCDGSCRGVSRRQWRHILGKRRDERRRVRRVMDRTHRNVA